MTTYRRKPEYVSAVQLTQQTIDAHVLDRVPLPEGCRLTSSRAHPPTRTVQFAAVRLVTPRLELVMPGDWIVRSADGVLSVCRPDAFEAMYEAVPDEPPRSEADHDAHGGKYLEPFDRGRR